MSSTDDETNPYELLELKLEATEQEIRTAYRQRSLKVHPDRVRNPCVMMALTAHRSNRIGIIPMQVGMA
jgi:curved DNA-binding protein CbpA